jgi:hypothetical protein
MQLDMDVEEIEEDNENDFAIDSSDDDDDEWTRLGHRQTVTYYSVPIAHRPFVGLTRFSNASCF